MEKTLSIEEKKDIQEIMFCIQLLEENNLVTLSIYNKKKFQIVGTVLKKIDLLEPKKDISRGIEIILKNQSSQRIIVLYQTCDALDNISKDTLIKITKLRLYPDRYLGKLLLMLAATKITQVISLIPDHLTGKHEKNHKLPLEKYLSTPRSRKYSEFCMENSEMSDFLWAILKIDLSRYAQKNEQNGIKFPLKSLIKISDKVMFVGIVLSIYKKDDTWNSVYTAELRDVLTNDKVNVFIIYSVKNSNEKLFLESIQQYSVLRIICNRMVNYIQISKKLSIYCKLTLNLKNPNIEILNFALAKQAQIL